jgi:hypothetical protein
VGCTDRVGCMPQQLFMRRCQKRGLGDQNVDERFARGSQPENLASIQVPVPVADQGPLSGPLPSVPPVKL